VDKIGNSRKKEAAEKEVRKKKTPHLFPLNKGKTNENITIQQRRTEKLCLKKEKSTEKKSRAIRGESADEKGGRKLNKKKAYLGEKSITAAKKGVIPDERDGRGAQLQIKQTNMYRVSI